MHDENLMTFHIEMLKVSTHWLVWSVVGLNWKQQYRHTLLRYENHTYAYMDISHTIWIGECESSSHTIWIGECESSSHTIWIGECESSSHTIWIGECERSTCFFTQTYNPIISLLYNNILLKIRSHKKLDNTVVFIFIMRVTISKRYYNL